jgi:hypothetical protein
VGRRAGKDCEGAIIKRGKRWGVGIAAYQNLRSSEEWGGWLMVKVGLGQIVSSGTGWEWVMDVAVILKEGRRRLGSSGEEL